MIMNHDIFENGTTITIVFTVMEFLVESHENSNQGEKSQAKSSLDKDSCPIIHIASS